MYNIYILKQKSIEITLKICNIIIYVKFLIKNNVIFRKYNKYKNYTPIDMTISNCHLLSSH